MKNEFNEQNISQIPALEVVAKMGYKKLTTDVADSMRGSLDNVILKDILYKKLIELNEYEYKESKYKFSKKNIEQAVRDLDIPLVDGLVKTNEKIYDALLLGRSYPEKLPDGNGTRSFSLKYVDWEHPENNEFHMMEEFIVERMDGKGTIRPDIVLFVNGIPFGVIECKKSSITVNQGISQMIRNQKENYIPQLFKYVQVVMATNKNEAKYATSGTPKKFWSVWKEEESDWYTTQLSKFVTDRTPTNQDQNIISLFHPKRLIELTQYFTLYDKNIKKIARYQQYFAIKEIIDTIGKTNKDGNRQSGVIWHTQGSGKSLTMVMLTRFILSEMTDIHPKVLVITDRISLDEQIHKTFNHSRLNADRAKTGHHLVELLNTDGADVITSLVHKFDTASGEQDPIESKDIFVLVDESHRTQYGELHMKMKKVLPNACYLGFTGTPLMKKEKSTMVKFGKLIHKYTIKDGVDDKAILPLLYEGRMIEQTVNQKAIDTRLEIITRNLSEKQKEEVLKKWSKFERIASSEQRINLVAYDINEHFKNSYKNKDSQFKAMLATSSKKEAVQYLKAFEDLGDLNCAVVISPPDQREGHEAIDETSKDIIINFWNKMMNQYGDAERYEQHVKSDFVDGDEIDLLIVVDKLLTGFDAPRATVLYIDKPMKEHNLLQAIARVNRLYEGKDFGYIVDYRGLINQLNDAMETYSGAGLENFDSEDLKGALVDVISVVSQLRGAYSNLVQHFSSISYKNVKDKIQQYAIFLEDDKLRDDFYNYLREFAKFMGIALESEHVYNALGEEELGKYKRDLKFFQELRGSVKLQYSDTIDHKEYEAKMQSIMDNYIAAEEVIRITNPVNILDEKGFEKELDDLGSRRAKADAIRTRMTKHISKKYQEDPAFYKKFSELITETIENYREKRISDAEYLQSMNKLKDDLRKGNTGVSYPKAIKNNNHAQAFYGVTKEVIENVVNIEDKENEIAELALSIDMIIDDHSKVDWHDNNDVHKKMKQDIDFLLFKFKRQHLPELNVEDFDKIIEENMKVALRRY
ncbi:type I restriction endonuclease subunit R [Haloplasma contractile]|nr:HsdR family type I site-specific deoxyribonuclease [Haloplasma contractile]